MKFNCGLSKEEKRRRRNERLLRELEWHDVFAIIPVRVEEGDCRWLETIETRRVGDYNADGTLNGTWTDWSDRWEYRAKK